MVLTRQLCWAPSRGVAVVELCMCDKERVQAEVTQCNCSWRMGVTVQANVVVGGNAGGAGGTKLRCATEGFGAPMTSIV